MANWTARDLAAQYNRAKKLGWLPHVAEAAEAHGHEPWDLLAVGSRESNLDPRYLAQTGDRGNGFGPWQVDKRYFPEWTRTGRWRDPREAVMKGAEILAAKRQEVLDSKGKRRTVMSRAGKKATFTGDPFTHAELRLIAFAAYNSGLWAYYHFSTSGDPDKGTTGKDYSADVARRAEVFRRLWEADRPETVAIDDDRDDPEPEPIEVPAEEPVAEVAPVATVQKVTSGSGSWLRAVGGWITTLAGMASGYVREAFNLSPPVQIVLIVLVAIIAVVWLWTKYKSEFQIREIAASPDLNSVK